MTAIPDPSGELEQAPAKLKKPAGLAAAIEANGGRFGTIIVREARRSGLPVALVCALIEQESTFRNVFGHDETDNPVKGGKVSRERYMTYLRYRNLGRGNQGVGPAQLTWPAFQDRADDLGGCWRPGPNIRAGCEVLAANIKRKGKKAGIQAYNGAHGFAYANAVLDREARWAKRLSAVKLARTPLPKPAGRHTPRTFRVKPNAMRGDDIKAFQRLLNARFAAWKIDIHVAEDGKYGADTRHAAKRVARGLGLDPGAYGDGITPAVRTLMRHPSRRTAADLARAKANRGWLDALRKQQALNGSVREQAWTEARRMLDLGVRESGGPNRGATVMKIIRANAGTGPEPWCGDFVAWCYRKAGSKRVQRKWAVVASYLPMTGLKRTRTPLKGDIVRFTWSHVGLFGAWCDERGREVGAAAATHFLTIEGNTGRNLAVPGSKPGGDGIYMKVHPLRHRRDFIHVRR